MANPKNQTLESKAVNETRCRLCQGEKKPCQNEGISQDVDDNKQARKLILIGFPSRPESLSTVAQRRRAATQRVWGGRSSALAAGAAGLGVREQQLPPFLFWLEARLRYEAKAEGGSCCSRTPRRVAQAQTLSGHKCAGAIAPHKSQNVCKKNKSPRPCNAISACKKNLDDTYANAPPEVLWLPASQPLFAAIEFLARISNAN
jgi:hypothetical protein